VQFNLGFTTRAAGKEITAVIPIKAHLVNNLRTNMLIGINMLAPHGISIDPAIPMPTARIASYQNTVLSIRVVAQENHQQPILFIQQIKW
jgi:hypothetical protein